MLRLHSNKYILQVNIYGIFMYNRITGPAFFAMLRETLAVLNRNRNFKILLFTLERYQCLSDHYHTQF